MTEYLTTGTKLPPYMIFPRFLLDSDLSETTKLLYMLLLDRARLSISCPASSFDAGRRPSHCAIAQFCMARLSRKMTVGQMRRGMCSSTLQSLIWRQLFTRVK